MAEMICEGNHPRFRHGAAICMLLPECGVRSGRNQPGDMLNFNLKASCDEDSRESGMVRDLWNFSLCFPCLCWHHRISNCQSEEITTWNNNLYMRSHGDVGSNTLVWVMEPPLDSLLAFVLPKVVALRPAPGENQERQTRGESHFGFASWAPIVFSTSWAFDQLGSWWFGCCKPYVILYNIM